MSDWDWDLAERIEEDFAYVDFECRCPQHCPDCLDAKPCDRHPRPEVTS